MSRPEVSVVMPFGGHPSDISAALDAFRLLDWSPGDELILADNVGVLPAGPTKPGPGGATEEAVVTVVPVSGERSPAHARNVGAAAASKDWILFLDADCRPLAGLLEAYFARPIAEDVGAVAGELDPVLGEETLAARYGAARNFLAQQAHLRHPYMPRAAAANLLVRRQAYEQVGGFYEGLRAAEDTDFTWRLQRAGWRLEGRAQARVAHRYRGSLPELRRQWRGYAAGRGWLRRRYEGFTPEPAVVRALKRVARHARRREPPHRADGPNAATAGRTWVERGSFVAVDAMLALEELTGLILSNRPDAAAAGRRDPADLVLVADRFPVPGDPLVELAFTLGQARIEAVARPDHPDLAASRHLALRYLEDDGAAARAVAGARVLARHPVLVIRDLATRRAGEPSTWTLAPAVRRLEHDREVRVHALGGGVAQSTAHRLATLAARPVE